MNLKEGDRLIYWPKGDYILIRKITTERTDKEVTKNIDLMDICLFNNPAKIPGVFGVISEIPGYAWIITAGNRAYLYSGLPGDGLTVAKNAIRDLPINAGCTVKSKLVVK